MGRPEQIYQNNWVYLIGDIIRDIKRTGKIWNGWKPIINLSGNGTIEIITEEKKHNIPSIEEIDNGRRITTRKENLVEEGNIKLILDYQNLQI